MNLLIVDDELWSRQLIRNILLWHEFGFEKIYEAENGLKALEILKDKHIDLTITDMRMTGMDGVELLKAIRQNDFITEVIVMSGYDDFKYIHQALKTKAIDYLLKPIVKEELIQAVNTGLDHINENMSYSYIEDILKRDDLKNLINKYYEIKNKIFRSINSINETELIKNIDLLDENYFLVDNKLLGEYIKIDLGRLIYKFKQDYSIKDENVKWIEKDFNYFKEELMKIFLKVKASQVEMKLDILEIQKYIDSHFQDAIALQDIADKYYISKEHLSRLFKKQVGETVQNYITQKRIENAKRLLRRHHLISISTISMMSGYLDVQYFYRVFKRQTGLTPNEYKNQEISI